MKRKNYTEQIVSNMLSDIKKNLPQKQLTLGASLAMLNGLALVYKKAIRDYEPVQKMVYETNMKEVLYCLYKKRENRGKDCGFNDALDLYLQGLPKEFVDLVDFNIFKNSYNKKAVEKEITKLAYKVVRKAASQNMRENEKLSLPSLSEVQKNINDLNSTKRILRDGLSKEIDAKRGDEGMSQMNEYVDSLVKKLVSSEVEYCSSLAESVVRFYSNVELERQAEERESYFRDFVYVDRTLKDDEIERA